MSLIVRRAQGKPVLKRVLNNVLRDALASYPVGNLGVRTMMVRKATAVVSVVCLTLGVQSVLGSQSAVAERIDRGDSSVLAKFLVEKGGVRCGLCAVLGCRDEKIALEVARQSELVIHVREPAWRSVEAARKLLDDAGLYGTRVVVEKGSFERLPYADNIMDVVVCVSLSDEVLDAVSASEILRVLRPEGKAILGRGRVSAGEDGELTRPRLSKWLSGVKALRASVTENDLGLWAELVKPAPDGVDDWTHWQHGPDNNPFSEDRVIKAPYLTQFLALPWFSAIPSISVISGGRAFRASGHIAFHDREERYVNTLYATNAYNGTVLWTRPIPTGFLVHRSMFVATPQTLYLMDNDRCLLLDAQTGAEKDAVVVQTEEAEGGHWKWIALDGGVLYALLGGKEYEAEVVKRHRPTGAWGWDELSKGYYEKDYPWGFGKTIVAIEPQTKKILWSHKEEKAIDSRALCMSGGRIFLHSEGAFVGCLDQKSGEVLWKNDNPRLLAAISEANDRGLGFKTTPYALCTEKWLFLAGRGRKNVVAVSAEDGKFLWSIPGAYNATNLLFQGGHLYAHIASCSMIEPLTGRIVRDIGTAKRSCARFTGCPDSLFHRGSIREGEGATRYDLSMASPTVIHAFRPPCMDGIIPAEGLLHVTAWVCDCNLQLIGMISLAPAGSFEFNREAKESERLETAGDPSVVSPLGELDGDWATYRADNYRSSSTSVNAPEKVVRGWEFEPKHPFSPSPLTAAGGLIFLGGSDCRVRAIEATTGKERWSFFTGGPLRLPPSIWKGRVLVGCADGCVYALEAASGRLLWRFRAAPAERKIPVYGSLSSTWPVNSGVLVEDGVAYAAAGIINYDGTHVYALDAATGKIKWQNNTSGHLNKELREGASVQGNLALLGDKLLLAGGNVTSPAMYRSSDGKCLNPPPGPGWPAANRGSEACGFMKKYAMVGGRRLFTQDDDLITNWQPYEVLDVENVTAKLATEFQGRVPPAFGNGVIAFSGRGPLLCLDAENVEQWLRKERTGVKERWRANSVLNSVSVVICGNAVLAAGETALAASASPSRWTVQAFEIKSGKMLWAEFLPSPPLPGGLCMDAAGRVIVVLESGKIVCLASPC